MAMPAVMLTLQLPPPTPLQNCQLHQFKTRSDSLTARKAAAQQLVRTCLTNQADAVLEATKRQAVQLPEGFILASGSSFTASGLALVCQEADVRRMVVCRPLPIAVEESEQSMG